MGIVGVCAILLGGLALYQSWRLLIAGRAATLHEATLARRNEQYLALGLAVERAHVASMRGDGPALHEAVRDANRAMATPALALPPDPAARAIRPTPSKR